jgi:hypothetical protein
MRTANAQDRNTKFRKLRIIVTFSAADLLYCTEINRKIYFLRFWRVPSFVDFALPP